MFTCFQLKMSEHIYNNRKSKEEINNGIIKKSRLWTSRTE